MDTTSTLVLVFGLTSSQWAIVLSIVQSLAAIVLAVLTGMYLIEARKTREASQGLITEIRNDRVLNARPIIIPTSLHINDPHAFDDTEYCIIFHMENIGNGATLSLEVAMYDPETNRRLASSTHSVDYLNKEGKTDDNHLHVGSENLNSLRYAMDRGEMTTRILLKMRYKDIFGEAYTSERQFSLVKDAENFQVVLGSFKLNSIWE